MEHLLDRILQIFSLEYMFSVIIASYFIIKAIDSLNGDKAVPTNVKRLITFGVGAISFWIFRTFTEVTFETLVSSYFAAVFFYDAVIKYLIQKLDVDYKKPKHHDHANDD